MEECTNEAYSIGEIVLIQCPAFHCKEKPWCYCHSCMRRCYRNGLNQHASRKIHRDRHLLKYPPVMPVPAPAPPPISQSSSAYHDIFEVSMTSGSMFPIDNDDLEEAMVNSETYIATMEEDLALHSNDNPSPLEVAVPAVEGVIKCDFPKVNLEGNQWLITLLADTPQATLQEVTNCFQGSEMENFKFFWTGELATGMGHCGGGIVLLVGRTFQQVKDSALDRSRLPMFPEALWQFLNLVQHQSMTEKQRLRQSRINTMLVGNIESKRLFLKHTFIPLPEQLGRYYGGTGQHSMLNNLPCPKAVDVDGVAYVSPKTIIAFCLANGIPIDDVYVMANSETETFDGARTVNHASESRKAVAWRNAIRTGYYNGAPHSKIGAPKHPVVICVGVSDWTDGFGPGKVKNNRNAVDCKSFTVSPPKQSVNDVKNTFPVAMGLKKSVMGWRKVERLFRQELESLTSATEPILFYHGRLQKVVPCFFKRFVVMSDKAERNGLTGTIGCGSNSHRCFSISGIISTPSCKHDDLTKFLSSLTSRNVKANYGWSHDFVNSKSGNNGAVFPSCRECRQKNLEGLGMEFGKKKSTNSKTSNSCTKCCDWELLPSCQKTASMLDFPSPDNYPTQATEGSPVPPPVGRDEFGEETKLPFMQLSWNVMMQGCRFAFFQACRKRGWTKIATTTYLRMCGVSTSLSAELYNAAKECLKANKHESVNYFDKEGIGDFKFPAPWLSKEISLRDYIEGVMHQLFLGITDSNFELIQMWLKEQPSSSKLSSAAFKDILQGLIKDLRPFQLSWLAAYPLTGKKGNLGTGSWVAENYVFLVRISQLIFGWCARNPENNSKYGVNDMSRMVIAFHAVVARCMTHGGINDSFIRETEQLIKEFLSAVREFDIFVRHGAFKSQGGNKKGPREEAWWLKPNFMSLFNLVSMMFLLGPLVEYWDGGGKGERFIQVVKPHIKRGVREDMDSFFGNLINKIYRGMQLDLMEFLYGLVQGKGEECNMLEVLGNLIDDMSSLGEDDTTTQEENGDNNDVGDYGVDDDTCFSANEALGMTKKKTIFVYRNKGKLQEAFLKKKPIAGYVEVSQRDGKTSFEFHSVHRKPVKQFVRQKIAFDDSTGVHFHGLWCAKIQIDWENVKSTGNFTDIQAAAKLAAVAIPLSYVIGKEHLNSDKYCVITNWWKYRMKDGWYRLPCLDESLYGGQYVNNKQDSAHDSSTVTSIPMRLVNGMEVGVI